MLPSECQAIFIKRPEYGQKRTTEPDCAPVWSGIYRSGTEKKWTNLEVLNYHHGTLEKESIRAQFAAQITLSCRMMVNNWACITDAVVSENILTALKVRYVMKLPCITLQASPYLIDLSDILSYNSLLMFLFSISVLRMNPARPLTSTNWFTVRLGWA